jgi:hypothetical protein
MVGGPGRGLSGATTLTRWWSPSSAGIGDGWWACPVGGAGWAAPHFLDCGFRGFYAASCEFM